MHVAALLLALLLSSAVCVEVKRQRLSAEEASAGSTGVVQKMTAGPKPYELRTEYDYCVSNEFRVTPESRHQEVALTCYKDCLRAKASFAPRICLRFCLNALERHYIDMGAEICASVCPEAATSMQLADTFCPTL